MLSKLVHILLCLSDWVKIIRIVLIVWESFFTLMLLNDWLLRQFILCFRHFFNIVKDLCLVAFFLFRQLLKLCFKAFSYFLSDGLFDRRRKSFKHRFWGLFWRWHTLLILKIFELFLLLLHHCFKLSPLIFKLINFQSFELCKFSNQIFKKSIFITV